jgi:hypothetical protein
VRCRREVGLLRPVSGLRVGESGSGFGGLAGGRQALEVVADVFLRVDGSPATSDDDGVEQGATSPGFRVPNEKHNGSNSSCALLEDEEGQACKARGQLMASKSLALSRWECYEGRNGASIESRMSRGRLSLALATGTCFRGSRRGAWDDFNQWEAGRV